MNIRLFCIQTAVAAALVTAAGASAALDLIGSYEKARQADPTMRAAAEAVRAGREKAVQGRALLLPQVSLSAGYAHVDDKSATNLPPALTEVIKPESSGQVHQEAVQLVQPLYNAKAAADHKQSQQRTELSEIGYRNARQDLIERVSEAYFGVLLAQEALRVTQAEKAAVAMQRDRAKARFEVGRGRITDLQEAQACYDSVLAKEVSAESTLALREAQYEELTGVRAQGLAELRPGFQPTPPQPDNLRDWQQKSRALNPRVQAKERELAIAAFEIDKHKLSGRPTVELVASYTNKGQNGGLSPTIAPNSNRAAMIGVQLSIPLFAGGALDSRERESLAKKRQAEEELSAAQRDARLQVQDAWLAVKKGAARIAALEQSLLSAQTALEATTLGRDVGSRTELDVLDAQQRVFGAQLDLAQARNDYLLGRVRLASAAGALQEDDLRALNAYLVSQSQPDSVCGPHPRPPPQGGGDLLPPLRSGGGLGGARWCDQPWAAACGTATGSRCSSRSTSTSPSSTRFAVARSMSFSHAATTTVATQLPIRLPSARAMPMNQSTESTSTSPIAGIAGIAESVAARMTIAEPGTPCAPFEVISDTPRISSRSVVESGVLVACAMNTAASVR
jgi:outer membrane protein